MRLIDADKLKIDMDCNIDFGGLDNRIMVLEQIDNAPTVEERLDQKCTDCNEYNQEKHYCPKFCDVIRDTTKEMQEFYKGEHEKLEQIEQIVRDYGLINVNLLSDDLTDFEKDILREILEEDT